MISKKEILLSLERKWRSEYNDSEEWYEKGICLYDNLMRVDHYNRADYSKKQVDLLLSKANDEKMRHGNYKRAEILLKRIIDTEPNHPEVYYRLAFINAYFEKWEAALFYANETLVHLKYGSSLDKEIKLYTLMGCAYTKIGLKKRGKENFEDAESLDKEKEWTSFIDDYKDLANTRNKRNMKVGQDEISNIRVAQQKVRKGLCYILSVHSRRNYFITSNNQILIAPKEAELLAFLIQQGEPVSKEKILNHIWPELSYNPDSSVVKATIARLRPKLQVEFEEPIITLDDGYKINIPTKIVIFKGIDFDRLSCY